MAPSSIMTVNPNQRADVINYRAELPVFGLNQNRSFDPNAPKLQSIGRKPKNNLLSRIAPSSEERWVRETPISGQNVAGFIKIMDRNLSDFYNRTQKRQFFGFSRKEPKPCDTLKINNQIHVDYGENGRWSIHAMGGFSRYDISSPSHSHQILERIKVELEPKDVMNSRILIKPMGLDKLFKYNPRTAPASVQKAFFDIIKTTTQGSFTWADRPHRILSGLFSNDVTNKQRNLFDY